MTDERKKRAWWPTVVAAILVPLVLYVASAGPVMRYRFSDPSRVAQMSQLHIPIWRIAALSSFVGKPLVAYLNLWLPDGKRAEWRPEFGVGISTSD